MALFLGIFLMGILLVPGVVQDAEAMTEAECLELANLSPSELESCHCQALAQLRDEGAQ